MRYQANSVIWQLEVGTITSRKRRTGVVWINRSGNAVYQESPACDCERAAQVGSSATSRCVCYHRGLDGLDFRGVLGTGNSDFNGHEGLKLIAD